jgi:hypothetical protein
MTIKTGILAAAAALALTIPAAAMAQPAYDHASSYRNGYDSGYRETRADFRHDDWRRIEREREIRRMMEMRRLRWEREHAWRDHGYGDFGYRR